MTDKIIEELEKLKIKIKTVNGFLSQKQGFYNSVIEKSIEIVKKHEDDGWISVKKRLPSCEVEVQITTRRKHKDEYSYIVTNAFYEDGTMPTEDSDWTWIECDFKNWDEEADCYLIDEGWWEYKHYNPEGEYNNAVDDEVVAWKALPQPYKGE